MRHWTCHWQNRFWNHNDNNEAAPICFSGSNLFSKRGVQRGDRLYVLSLRAGALLLGGRMTVEGIVSREEAVRIKGNEDLYGASEWAIAQDGSGTRLDLHRELAPEIAAELQFVSASSKPKGLFFVTPTQLDVQATRGVRELTEASARLLDRVLSVTDSMPRSAAMRRVTLGLLSAK